MTENKSETNSIKTTQGAWAVLPIGIFLLLYLGAGIIFRDFYRMPAIVAFLIALLAAFLQNRTVSVSEKISIIAQGLSDDNVITMCLIFLAAGAFSGAVQASGGVESTVHLGLSILPGHFAVVGLFIICCFISIAMGTSVGTISALAPVAAGISQKTGLPLALCLGAAVSGAMFGDNLSIISDTTIAAAKTQQCTMQEKFRTNFFVVLPAAVITALLFFVLSSGRDSEVTDDLSYNLLQILPYIAVLIGALMGFHVLIVLVSGTVFSLVIGILTGTLSGAELFTCMGSGIASMYDITVISIIVNCISTLIAHNGGIQWIMQFIRRHIHSQRTARLGVAVLAVGTDIATANNTLAILMAAPVARETSAQYKIPPRITASILDIFSSVTQGLLPYSAQLLYAAAAAAQAGQPLSSFNIIAYTFYPMLMAVCALLWIFISAHSAKFSGK